MKHNILYISNGVDMGGAEQSLVDMLKGMKQKEIMPIVIIPRHGIIEMRLRELDIKYYVIDFTNGYGKIGTCTPEDEENNFYDNFKAALLIQDVIKREKIEMIHINSSVSNVGAFAAIMANIPYVWHFREFLEEDFDSEFWDKELKLQLIKRASSMITISDAVSQSYKQKYDIDSVRIYNGIDVERYKTNLEDVYQGVECHRFLITGVVSANKGQWDAVKAVQALVEEGIENIHLAIVGRGTESFRWLMKKYIQSNNLEHYVDVLDFKSDLAEYRKLCQYSLTTSKMEALGRCTIEAMFSGNIVIGADTGGTREIIGEDESRGYLYKQGNWKSLADIMKKVIQEDAVQKEVCRRNAQEYVDSVFSLEKYTDTIYELYEKVLGESKEVKGQKDKSLLAYLNNRYQDICHRMTDRNVEEKVSEYDTIVSKWNEIENKNCGLSAYCQKKNYRNIAIYGMGNLGVKVYDAISSEKIVVDYVIDRNAKYIEELFEVKKPEDALPKVDLLIVALAKGGNEIVNHYSVKYDFDIMTIEKILDEILYSNE